MPGPNVTTGALVQAVVMPYPPNEQLGLIMRDSDVDPVLDADSPEEVDGAMASEPEEAVAQFPRQLLEEAARTPDGWVYETDSGRVRQDGFVPIEAIIRGWKISPQGIPTGEVWVNPDYGGRAGPGA
jgi:hypothetical protein